MRPYLRGHGPPANACPSPAVHEWKWDLSTPPLSMLPANGMHRCGALRKRWHHLQPIVASLKGWLLQAQQCNEIHRESVLLRWDRKAQKCKEACWDILFIQCKHQIWCWNDLKGILAAIRGGWQKGRCVCACVPDSDISLWPASRHYEADLLASVCVCVFLLGRYILPWVCWPVCIFNKQQLLTFSKYSMT